jgi:cobalt-zinc-cadmium efflux system membrane fusion protein
MKLQTVLVALALAGMATACGRNPTPPTAETPEHTAAEREHAPHDDGTDTVEVEVSMLRDLRITTQTVESRTAAERLTLLGELAVDQRHYAEVGAPVVARVTRVLAFEGDVVRRGAVLAELTSPDLGRARAEYQSAQARATLARTALERVRGLAAERIAPARQVQEAEAELATAEGAVRSARAAAATFGVDLAEGETAAGSTFVLRSPLAGAVIDQAAVVGQMLAPETTAFRVGDLALLWLTVHAFERDAVRITPGTPARVAMTALPGHDVQGTVRVVGRHVDPESRTVDVRIDVRNPRGVLRPGMTATAVVPVGDATTEVLAVPVTAVQRVRDAWCVFLPQSPGHFTIRRIGRGRDLGGEVEVLSGLSAGDTVVVDGAFLLKAQAEKATAGHDGH